MMTLTILLCTVVLLSGCAAALTPAQQRGHLFAEACTKETGYAMNYAVYPDGSVRTLEGSNAGAHDRWMRCMNRSGYNFPGVGR